jgi:hypothetical protein
MRGSNLAPGAERSAVFPFPLPSARPRLAILFEGVAFALDRRHPLVMLPFGLIESCLGLVDGLLAALALLLPGGLLPPALAFTPLFLLLECERGLAFRIGVSPSGRTPL